MGIKNIKKKALVTGGGGFIGSRLVKTLLRTGFAVTVLDVQPGFLKGETDPNLELIGIRSDGLRGGMADRSLVEQAVKNVDVIYHLAINWDWGAQPSALRLADLFDVNVRGTLNLLEVAKFHGVKHFISASSCAVYGEPESSPIDEETLCKPELSPTHLSAYGIMKLTTEKLCLMYYHHYGIPVTTFRIEVVFSDDESLLSALSREYIDKIIRNENIGVLDDEGCASIHVDEVVDAFLLATLNNKAYGHVFNVSNPATYITHGELYEFIIQLTGSKSKIEVIPSGRRISCMPESIEKIQRILGWKPQKTKEDLKKAVAETVKSIISYYKA
ncbi:MAG: NAD(P)-dependent oxidoreductase [Candidatus Bathyarchaeota archaeon]|nr:NAD(P)-dependent oxidoreductase [Candidatus Bathyarchaeota archaeon]MDH5494350.1 NAD(P)-dependent oxidoreductase [Candidatus Bathyarchaeota archaeon]